MAGRRVVQPARYTYSGRDSEADGIHEENDSPVDADETAEMRGDAARAGDYEGVAGGVLLRCGV